MVKTLSSLALRIQERLNQLNMTPSDAVKRAGLSKDFVYDIYNGKKVSPRTNNLQALAKALECDLDYLTGKSSVVQSAARENYSAEPDDYIQMLGFVGAGMWTEGSLNNYSINWTRRSFFPNDKRFSSANQFDLEIQGTSANRICVPGQVARCVYSYSWPWPLRSGDLVVAVRTKGELSERSIRRLKTLWGENGVSIGFTLQFESDQPHWTSQAPPRVDVYGQALDDSDDVNVEAVVIYIYGLATAGDDREL